jgi:hypothetical protein
METLVKEETDRVTQNVCTSCVQHARNLQEDYSKEIRCEKVLKPLSIHKRATQNTTSNNDDEEPTAAPLG